MKSILTAAAVFCTFFTPPASAGAVLSESEIVRDVTERTFVYKGFENGRKKEGSIVYGRNGNLYIKTVRGYIDSGTWKTMNGRVCTRVTIGRRGQQKCFKVFREADGTYSTDHNYRLFRPSTRVFSGVDKAMGSTD